MSKDVSGFPLLFDWNALQRGDKTPLDERSENRLTVGETVDGRYHIKQILFRGPQSSVFACRDALQQQNVAIKVLSSKCAADRVMRARFVEAGRKAVELVHENIAKVHSVHEDEQIVYLVMELVTGVRLSDEMVRRVENDQDFAIDEIQHISRQLCSALEPLHRAGQQFDLTPRNLILTTEGVLKLIGVAKPNWKTNPADELDDDNYDDLVPPEKANTFTPDDERASVYTVSALVHRLLIGTRAESNATPLHQVDPVIPVGLSRAVARGLSDDPAQRFSSLSAFRRSSSRMLLPIWAWPIIFAALFLMAGLGWVVYHHAAIPTQHTTATGSPNAPPMAPAGGSSEPTAPSVAPSRAPPYKDDEVEQKLRALELDKSDRKFLELYSSLCRVAEELAADTHRNPEKVNYVGSIVEKHPKLVNDKFKTSNRVGFPQNWLYWRARANNGIVLIGKLRKNDAGRLELATNQTKVELRVDEENEPPSSLDSETILVIGTVVGNNPPVVATQSWLVKVFPSSSP